MKVLGKYWKVLLALILIGLTAHVYFNMYEAELEAYEKETQQLNNYITALQSSIAENSRYADVQDKLADEVEELREAAESGVSADAPHGVREEVGDVLFMAVQVARDHGVDPEDALHRACDKFAARFRRTEELAGGAMKEMSADELVACWQKAKEQEQ